MAKIALSGKAKISHRITKSPKKDPIPNEYGERSVPFTIKLGSFILIASIFVLLLVGIFSKLMK